jgi:flagellar hook-associated protein 3 FlgL
MRVTANTFPNSLLTQLTSLSQRQNKLQNQAATGQRVQLPEDDPVAMRRILDMQAEGKSVSQYQRNIARHQELAAASFNSIKALKNVSDRARELSISADSLKSQDELNLYAKEVTELIKQAVHTTNVKNRGDYLFSGTLSDQPPFVLTTDADGNVTGVTYQGNTSLAETENRHRQRDYSDDTGDGREYEWSRPARTHYRQPVGCGLFQSPHRFAEQSSIWQRCGH